MASVMVLDGAVCPQSVDGAMNGVAPAARQNFMNDRRVEKESVCFMAVSW
ncbi:MAG: hypothetical protein BWY09_00668 [Candidatus Hydrogenedentes bacterium ADurb.Bin179]|nr:MAG: hypothetical protein BWY09_00668 [Candidatus Hydrogenedentes bacterium ADurb.Bin179]